ncbi:MAG: thioredoxin fold domain-containing protein [Gammaproteobacteria bacterium]|nr:thioredoxin fold domain-containing protein [Gammaproteobacteria bacterium]
MRLVIIFSLLLFTLAQASAAEEKQHGRMLGVKTTETPHWFKESFLDFEEDVAEAAAEGRRVMLYFHQEGCPYCAKLVEESFGDPQIEAFVREHFDGITINMWGDREVVSVSGRKFSEKTFAAALKVQYTPTLVFLDEQGKVALRLNGYYPKQDFRKALRFVATQGEKQGSFAEFVKNSRARVSGELIHEDFFTSSDRLDQLVGVDNKPLAVFFESSNCDNCVITHEKILTDAPTRALVKQTTAVQLDINSDRLVTTPAGERMTVSEWASRLGITYSPSVVLFDREGIEVMRIGAFLKTFHFQSVFAYVLEEAYKQQPSFQRYISSRGDKIRETGFDTDIWGYQSSHQ